MFRFTCAYQRLDDSTYSLIPNENWSIKERSPILLKGALAHLWEQLLHWQELSSAQQRVLFRQMSRPARTRLVTGLTAFQSSGLVELHPDEQPLNVALRNPQLLKLHLELTHRCNFRCTACYLGERLRPSNGDQNDEGTTEDWVRVIREASELGCSYATVTGGEPFLRKDILEILDALSDECIIAEINTNASAITPQIADRLTSVLLSSISVSLYGHDRESAQQYSGNGAGFRATMKVIRLLRERHLPLMVKYFVTRENIAGVDRLRSELGELKVNLSLIGHTIHGDIFQGKQLGGALEVAELERPNVVQYNDLPCHPTRTELAIEPNGNIRACPKISIYFGNAFQTSLKEIWRRSSDMTGFREFWVNYCEEEGYVKGSTQGSLCPASRMLSKSTGFNEFQNRWKTWQNGGQLVQINAQ